MWRSWGMWRCGRTNVSQGKKSIGDGRDQQEMVLASFWHGCLHLCNFLCWNVADLTEATVFSILFLEQKDPLQGVLSVDQLQAGLLRALFFAGFSETFSHPGSDSKKKQNGCFFCDSMECSPLGTLFVLGSFFFCPALSGKTWGRVLRVNILTVFQWEWITPTTLASPQNFDRLKIRYK